MGSGLNTGTKVRLYSKIRDEAPKGQHLSQFFGRKGLFTVRKMTLVVTVRVDGLGFVSLVFRHFACSFLDVFSAGASIRRITRPRETG